MSSSQLGLSAASDDRKARLAKLKNLKRKQPTDEIVAPESERSASPPAEPDVSRLHVSGRNYDHETRGPKLGFEAPPTLGLEKQTLEEQAAALEAEVKQKAVEEAQDDKGIDLFKLQPKKPNWDLKRELDKKMEVLNVRTDNAIARLVRDRITGAQKAAEKSKTAGSGQGDGEATGMDVLSDWVRANRRLKGLRLRSRARSSGGGPLDAGAFPSFRPRGPPSRPRLGLCCSGRRGCLAFGSGDVDSRARWRRESNESLDPIDSRRERLGGASWRSEYRGAASRALAGVRIARWRRGVTGYAMLEVKINEGWILRSLSLVVAVRVPNLRVRQQAVKEERADRREERKQAVVAQHNDALCTGSHAEGTSWATMNPTLASWLAFCFATEMPLTCLP
ncbi:cwf18 pre-mRNA splicing factor [Ilyonectria robusta]